MRVKWWQISTNKSNDYEIITGKEYHMFIQRGVCHAEIRQQLPSRNSKIPQYYDITIHKRTSSVFSTIGALADRKPGAGDGCPVWYVNWWALGWSCERPKTYWADRQTRLSKVNSQLLTGTDGMRKDSQEKCKKQKVSILELSKAESFPYVASNILRGIPSRAEVIISYGVKQQAFYNETNKKRSTIIYLLCDRSV